MRAEVQASKNREIVLAPVRLANEPLVLDLFAHVPLPGLDDATDAFAGRGIGRIPPQRIDRRNQGRLLFISASDDGPLYRTVALKEIDRAPVREPLRDHAGEAPEQHQVVGG